VSFRLAASAELVLNPTFAPTVQHADEQHRADRFQHRAVTAVVMLQLGPKNRLSIDESLRRWLPQYPRWRDVTIRSLFKMTGGIGL
jgi:hypothetical protein